MRIVFLAILLSLCAASQGMAHDPLIPVNDSWYESLKVPNDGLALQKGYSCCHKSDCQQRSFTPLAPGLFSVDDERTGNTVIFTEQMRITDPDVIQSNPYFQATTCIWNGQPVCYVPGRTGG